MVNYIDAGLFGLMLGFALIFMFMGYRRMEGDKLWQMLSWLLFTIIALVLVSEYQVAYTETISDGTETWSDYKILIGTNGSWMGWIFFILGLVNIAMFILYWRQDKEQARKAERMEFWDY